MLTTLPLSLSLTMECLNGAKSKKQSKRKKVQKAIKPVPVKVIKAAEEVETGLLVNFVTVNKKWVKWTKVGTDGYSVRVCRMVRRTVTGVAG